MMKYKGYSAIPQYSAEDKCFHGTLLGISDCVMFEGRTVDELETAFQESVDEYLACCEEDGIQPKKPFSGKFNLRLEPDVHAKVVEAAASHNVSLNQYVSELIRQNVG